MRRALVGAGALVLVGCGSDPVDEPTASTTEAVKVCAMTTAIEGIDISHWQDTIDWPAVKGDGVEFALAKATEATDYVDPTFDTNRAEAKAAGIAFGAYHFFRSDEDPTVQAQHFATTLGSVEVGEISPVLDLETADGEGGTTIVERALTFLEVLESLTGRVPIIYTSPSFYESTLDAPASLGAYPLWIANWETSCPTVPTTWADWSVWQYTDSGSVNGIGGPVDRDQFDGTVAELQCVGVECAIGTCEAGVCPTASGGSAGSVGTGGSGSEGTGLGGTTALGGAGGLGGEAGAAPPSVMRASSDDDSGCGCRTPVRSPTNGWLLMLAAIAIGSLRRKR
jgi:GH25 family lysozyme M1 (1,4-beta-N-acetylmuramidase)